MLCGTGSAREHHHWLLLPWPVPKCGSRHSAGLLTTRASRTVRKRGHEAPGEPGDRSDPRRKPRHSSMHSTSWGRAVLPTQPFATAGPAESTPSTQHCAGPRGRERPLPGVGSGTRRPSSCRFRPPWAGCRALSPDSHSPGGPRRLSTCATAVVAPHAHEPRAGAPGSLSTVHSEEFIFVPVPRRCPHFFRTSPVDTCQGTPQSAAPGRGLVSRRVPPQASHPAARKAPSH